MNDNPYNPPQPITSTGQYYSDDMILLPAKVIWRMLYRQSKLGALLFPYFMARKLLNLRHPPNYAFQRITELPAIAEEQIPPDVGQAFKPLNEVCEANDMVHMGYYRAHGIGNRMIMHSYWLDATATMYSTITWIEISMGALRNNRLVFACHSCSESGIELHTSPVKPQDWIPELIPPGHELFDLPPDSTPSKVIQTHRERIANRTDIRRFDKDSLIKHIIRSSQDQFDFMYDKGFYAPLTAAEAIHLAAVRYPAPKPK